MIKERLFLVIKCICIMYTVCSIRCIKPLNCSEGVINSKNRNFKIIKLRKVIGKIQQQIRLNLSILFYPLYRFSSLLNLSLLIVQIGSAYLTRFSSYNWVCYVAIKC